MTGAAAAKGEGKGGRRRRGFLAVSRSRGEPIPKCLAYSPGAGERDKTWGYGKGSTAGDGLGLPHTLLLVPDLCRGRRRRGKERKAVCTFD